MSAIITRAPSSRNFRAIPAPKPEAPPVTSAVLPSSRMSFPMMRGDRLQPREAVERLKSLLAAVARQADAAEGQLDAAAGAVVVEKDLARPQPARQPHRPAAVAGPDRGDEAVAGAVGDRHRLVLAVERDDHLDRAEDLLA